jgi:hypothetical protein
VAHRQVLVDQVERVAFLSFDGDIDEAEFWRPVRFLIGMEADKVLRGSDIVMR